MTDPRLPSVRDLATTMAVESIKGFGPQKFRELFLAHLTAGDVLAEPAALPISGKLGQGFREALANLSRADMTPFIVRAERQIETAHKHGAHILLHGSSAYPPNLWESNNPVPILYVLGNLEVLRRDKAVACVGSRGIAPPYSELQAAFVRFAVKRDWVITSGFAMGADSVAHRAAADVGGATICVMPCGLDRPFPPENKELWNEFRDYPGAVMVSEFAFGTAAAALTLRKRNKTIVALARGVLVGQSAAKGGAMNAFRFALEQKKCVASFKGDGTDRTSGNRLIGENPSGTLFSAPESDEGGWAAWLDSL